MEDDSRLGEGPEGQAREAGLRRCSGLLVRTVGDEVVILDTHRDQVHQLNVTAGLIWSFADQGVEPRQIAGTIAERFDISLQMAYEDVEEALSEFIRLHLLSETSRTRGSTQARSQMEQKE